jgi:hypothetical protein
MVYGVIALDIALVAALIFAAAKIVQVLCNPELGLVA